MNTGADSVLLSPTRAWAVNTEGAGCVHHYTQAGAEGHLGADPPPPHPPLLPGSMTDAFRGLRGPLWQNQAEKKSSPRRTTGGNHPREDAD